MAKIKNISPSLEKKVWEFFQSKRRRPIAISEIARELDLSPADKRAVRRYLKREAQNGRFLAFKKGRFMLHTNFTNTPWEKLLEIQAEEARAQTAPNSHRKNRKKEEKNKNRSLQQVGEKVVGILKVHPNGYGFVELDDGRTVFIPPHLKGEALHNDKVKAIEYPHHSKGSFGEIVQIIEPFSGRLVGQLISIERQFFFQDEERRYPLMPAVWKESRPQKFETGRPSPWVVGELVRSPFEPQHYWFEIDHFLSAKSGLELDKIRSIAKLEVEEFPPEVLRETASVAVPPTPRQLAEREDLRHLELFTIDGDDAYDFDDAVGFSRLSGGILRVYVAISDVAEYVREDTPLDLEARRRGTSVYFPETCLPMLPDPLSGNVCSLRPREERLALVAAIDFDQKARKLGSKFFEAVIKSRSRLTYRQVNELFRNPDAIGPDHPTYPHRESLLELLKLTRKLREARFARGSLDFDLPEPQVFIDEDTGEITDIQARERGEAEFLIEELMLQANEEVALFFVERELPTIFRVHPPPEGEKFQALFSMLNRMGVSLPTDIIKAFRNPDFSPSPRFVKSLIDLFKGSPVQHLAHHLILTSLKQAFYSTDNIGHFGLALENYLHFTSPIRRYPDLWVHRLLKRYLKGELPKSEKELSKLENKLAEIAEHSSKRERMAVEAEREVLARYRARFLQKKVGQVFSGIITGIAPFGVFVTLNEVFADGLVSIDYLPGIYYYDSELMAMIDQYTNHRIQLGDTVRVRVISASPITGKVEFELVE